MSLTDYGLGTNWSDTLPTGLRTYYEAKLLANIRTESIFVPLCLVKEDFAAKQTGVMTFTEVFDPEPDWTPVAENTLWMPGISLDTRQITLTLEGHGDVLKWSDYAPILNYWEGGGAGYEAMLLDKLGYNAASYLDILALNAHLAAPNVMYAGGKTGRFALTTSDTYSPKRGARARLRLEEMGIPGVTSVEDGGGMTVLGIGAPRIVDDIREYTDDNGKNLWWDRMAYAKPDLAMKFEAGAWGGVRYIKARRMLLRNYGVVTNQSTLAAPTVAGQAATATHQGYTVGQATSTRYVAVADASGFVAGQVVTIHSQDVNDADGFGGYAPSRADGTQEDRLIITVDTSTNRLTFDKPLSKPHAQGDYVTKGLDLTPVIIMGGPSVAMGVAERPVPTRPPKIDDREMINRAGWRAMLKFQQFRPEFVYVIWAAASDIDADAD